MVTLQKRGVDIYGVWYNPNIHPFTEYQKRLGALRSLQQKWNIDIEYIDTYGLREFLQEVVNREEIRCEYCYTVRLEETAKKARENGLDGFTTSLLVSPYQKSEIIVKTGKEMADKYNIEFIAEDFRSGYAEGVKMSKELNLYRQNYCGCIYSEMERFLGSKNGHTA